MVLLYIHCYWDQSLEQHFFLHFLDPLLLEMTIQKLSDNQESILVRLAAIEQLLKDTRGLKHPHTSKLSIVENDQDNGHPEKGGDSFSNQRYGQEKDDSYDQYRGRKEDDSYDQYHGQEEDDSYDQYRGRKEDDSYDQYHGREGDDSYDEYHGREGDDSYNQYHGREEDDSYDQYHGREGDDSYDQYHGREEDNSYNQYHRWDDQYYGREKDNSYDQYCRRDSTQSVPYGRGSAINAHSPRDTHGWRHPWEQTQYTQHYSTPTHHYNRVSPVQHFSYRSQSFQPRQPLPGGQPPRCQAIKPKKNAKVLAPSHIPKDKLANPSTVVAKYSKLCVDSKAPTLATKLAREAFFGDNVLSSCTVMGCREYNGLPISELNLLKQTIFNNLPKYWTNPVEFEPVWAACAESIGQTCKRLRRP